MVISLLRTWQERLTDTEKRKREELEELKVRNSHILHSHTHHFHIYPTLTQVTLPIFTYSLVALTRSTLSLIYCSSLYSQRAGILKVDNRLPNLVNLNEDPQLSDLLLYILKDGR